MGMMLLGRSSGSSDDVPGNAAMRDATRGSPDIERAGDMRGACSHRRLRRHGRRCDEDVRAGVHVEWRGSTRDELTFYFLDEA